MTFDRINTLYEKGNYRDLLEQLAGMEKELKIATFSVEEQLKCVFFKQQALMWLGKYKEMLAVVKQSRKKKIFSEQKIHQLALIVAELYALNWPGRFDDASKVTHKGEILLDSLTAEESIAGTFWIALFYSIKAVSPLETGESSFDDAITLLEQSVTLFESIGSPFDITRSLHNLGITYQNKGELNRALDYHQRVLTIAESKENKFLVAFQFESIADIYNVKGELDKALDHFQQAHTMFESLEILIMIEDTLRGIASVYRQKGEFETAHKYLQQSLRIGESLGNDYALSVTLFGLILVGLAQQNAGEAEKYLTQLQRLHTQSPIKTISQFVRLAEALVLKQSSRVFNKAQAQKLLTDIVTETEEELSSDLKILATIHLCELLLAELKTYGEPEVLQQAQGLIEKFYDLGQKQQSFSVIIEALILRAKFALIGGSIESAVKFLDQAQLLAKEKNLSVLGDKVVTEQDHLKEELEKWQNLLQTNASIQERLKLANLEEYVKKAKDLISLRND